MSDQHERILRDLASFTTRMQSLMSGLSPARMEALKRSFGDHIELPSIVEWASIAQNTLGAFLLFLFLLAVRNRFRIA